jgi:hypothetical protein
VTALSSRCPEQPRAWRVANDKARELGWIV